MRRRFIYFGTADLSSNTKQQKQPSCLIIGPRCTCGTFLSFEVKTIAKTRVNDLFGLKDDTSKEPLSCLWAGQFMAIRILMPLILPGNNNVVS